MMTTIILSMIVSFGITTIVGPIFIPFLRKLKFGQSILEIGPAWHKSKQGTPTMGGIMFITGIVIASTIFAANELSVGEYRPLAVIIFALVFGVIGFADDFIKVVKKRNLGLTAVQKLILQVLTSISFLFFLAAKGYISTKIFFPFINATVDFGWFFYPFALIAIVGMVNSVNLTDGLDGLAASVTVPVMALFSILAAANGAIGLASVATAVTGGCLGFLVYNFHPAKVFMGDTGSLFLGGAFCGIAFALNIPLIIFIAGFIYFAEAVSVMLQVTSFKLTGKRIFKMSPLHHHFELSGWSEVKIVYVFTFITAVLSIISYIGFSVAFAS